MNTQIKPYRVQRVSKIPDENFRWIVIGPGTSASYDQEGFRDKKDAELCCEYANLGFYAAQLQAKKEAKP